MDIFEKVVRHGIFSCAFSALGAGIMAWKRKTAPKESISRDLSSTLRWFAVDCNSHKIKDCVEGIIAVRNDFAHKWDLDVNELKLSNILNDILWLLEECHKRHPVQSQIDDLNTLIKHFEEHREELSKKRMKIFDNFGPIEDQCDIEIFNDMVLYSVYGTDDPFE